MKASLREKLDGMLERFEEIEAMMVDPEVINDVPRYKKILRERGSLQSTCKLYRKYQAAQEELAEANAILEGDGGDEELIELAEMQAEESTEELDKLEDDLISAVLTEDEESSKDVIIEIRAGIGGDEAALFAADLFRMYSRYAERKRFKVEVLDSARTGMGGFREITFGVKGRDVYHLFRYESGGHRVQRVPETESQGRIHTSAVTVAVLPEAKEVEVDINPSDLRIDTYSSSGPGGQSVNRTASAVRITYEPRNLVVQCQDEKSQHKNKARAMRILRSRLYELLRQEQAEERGELRRSQIGSGDRSERIRTYNYPQNRVTDHRAGVTLYALDSIMEGDLDPLIEEIRAWDKEERLKNL